MNNPKFTIDELRARAFLRVARVILGTWEERGGCDTRVFDDVLIPDNLVTVGESLEVARCRAQSLPLHIHREHVVPRLEIWKECLRIFEVGTRKGFSEEDLVKQAAAAIGKHLRIVIITKKEQGMLDGIPGLKMGMPKDWTFEAGDTYARLREAGIEFQLNENAF